MKRILRVLMVVALVLVILFVIMLIFTLNNVDNGATSPQTTEQSVTPTATQPKPSKAPVPKAPAKSPFELADEKTTAQIHATTLAQEYKDNEFAADAKYKGKLILVRGNITEFYDTFGEPSVNLKSNAMFVSVNCVMQNSYRATLARLKKGDDVLVIGKVGEFEFFTVSLDDCIIARSPTE